MENGLAVGFHGYLLPGHGNQLGSCHKNPPGFLTFKGQVPIGLSKGYHFRWQKITMGSMHLSEHISNTSNLVNPGRQETRTTGAHLCSQILRTAFCTLPPGRSWFNGIFVGPRGHVNITETVPPARPNG